MEEEKMLKHIAEVIPHLDCVKSYLDALQVEYRVIEDSPHNIDALDPLTTYVPFDCIRLYIRYKDDGIGLIIRKGQWK